MVKLVEMAALCRIVGEPLSSFAIAIRCVDGKTATVEDVGAFRHARTCDRWSLLGRRHLYGTPCSAEEQHQKDMELPPAPPRRRRKNCHVPLLTCSRRRIEPRHALAELRWWSTKVRLVFLVHPSFPTKKWSGEVARLFLESHARGAREKNRFWT